MYIYLLTKTSTPVGLGKMNCEWAYLFVRRAPTAFQSCIVALSCFLLLQIRHGVVRHTNRCWMPERCIGIVCIYQFLFTYCASAGHVCCKSFVKRYARCTYDVRLNNASKCADYRHKSPHTKVIKWMGSSLLRHVFSLSQRCFIVFVHRCCLICHLSPNCTVYTVDPSNSPWMLSIQPLLVFTRLISVGPRRQQKTKFWLSSATFAHQTVDMSDAANKCLLRSNFVDLSILTFLEICLSTTVIGHN